MEKIAKAIIKSFYGNAPDENSDEYQVYLMAVAEETEYLSSIKNNSGLKKMTLGDYSEEHFEGLNSENILCKTAKILLDGIYDTYHVIVFF